MSENPRSSDQGQGVGATVTILAILLVTLVPAVGMRLKTTPLNAGEWALVVGTVLLGTFLPVMIRDRLGLSRLGLVQLACVLQFLKLGHRLEQARLEPPLVHRQPLQHPISRKVPLGN